MKRSIFAIIIFVLASKAICSELLVPSQYPTIQTAIDAAIEGDAIVVQPGIYYENLQWDVNNLTLTSTDPENPDVTASTVIDGDGNNTVTLSSTVTTGLLTGFTITGGGYGIYGVLSYITINNCVIRDNSTGVSMEGTLSNCLVCNNRSTGIANAEHITNCTIVYNFRGVGSSYTTRTNITNSIIWGNSLEQISQISYVYPPSIGYSCIQDWPGVFSNTREDPIFVDAAGRDYRLQAGSPCIDAGINTWPIPMSARDLDGNFRQIDGNGDNIAVVDMGAFEYGTATGPIVSAPPQKLLFMAFENGPSLDPQTLYISNVGPGTLNWVIAEQCPWLTIEPASGSSSGEVASVTVTTNTAGLAVGSHNYELLISDSAGSGRALVQVNCAILDEDFLNVPSQYPTIQSAVDAADEGDTVVIAPGTYRGQGNMNIIFNGKSITVRSVDPNDPWVVDNTVVDCDGLGKGFTLVANCVLDGLTITDGFGSSGAGITISGSSLLRNCVIKNCSGSRRTIQSWEGNPTIIGCRITGNYAEADGGGIYCSGLKSITTLVDCDISDNTADHYGGGIYAYGAVIINNCRIVNNRSAYGGGIYYNNSDYSLKSTINKSLIAGNIASTSGGGIYSERGALVINDSIVVGNFSQNDGGGLYLGGHPYTTVTANGSAFAGNVAGGTGGVHINSGKFSAINSIFWGNSDSNETVAGAQIYPNMNAGVLFSCIQDDDANDANIPSGGEENGNIDDDPMFVRMPSDGGDGWGVGDNDDYGDLRLRSGSPCIDTGGLLYKGLGKTDFDGRPRVIGAAVDMGAYEYYKIILVNRPAQGEVWATGSKRKIEWAQFGIGGIDILFSVDNGESWQTLSENITDTNNYIWQVPDYIESNQCVIAIVPADGDANVICHNSGLFTVSWYPVQPAVPPDWEHRGLLPAPDLSENKGAERGCIKWVFETTGSVSSQVAVTRPYWGSYGIYIGCEDGNIYALDDTGEFIWSCDINTPIVGSPATGYYWMVYAAGQNGLLYAIDEYGDIRWTQTTNAPIYATPVVGYSGKIYACSLDGFIYAFDADGTNLWTFETKGPVKLKGSIIATPVIEADVAVYVAGLYDPNLYALDSNNGSIKWVCHFTSADDPNNTKRAQFSAPPAVDHDGTLYQTLVNDSNLYAIDPCTGAIIWTASMLLDPNANSSGWSSPAVGPDGTIYVSFDDPYLRAVEPDGTIKWVTRLGMVGGFTLSIDRDGYIYAASDDGWVCVINPGGTELSRFKGDNWLTFPAITEDGTLIVSDSDNRVWAITSAPCEGQPALHRIADMLPDWFVDFADFAMLANKWLECTNPADESCENYISDYGTYMRGDANRDLYVDYHDIAEMADKWLME